MIPRVDFGRTGHVSTRRIFGAAVLGGMSQASADATPEVVSTWWDLVAVAPGDGASVSVHRFVT